MKLHETIARRSAWLVCFAAAMSLMYAMGVVQLFAADDSQQGTVGIKLKLVPSQPEVVSESSPTGASQVGSPQAEALPAEAAKLDAPPASAQSDGGIELTQYADRTGPLGLGGRLGNARESSKPSVPRLWFEPAADQRTGQGNRTPVESATSDSDAPERIAGNRKTQRLARTPADSQASKLPSRELAEQTKVPTESATLELSQPRVSSRRNATSESQAATDEAESSQVAAGDVADQAGSHAAEESEECPGAPGTAGSQASEGVDSAEQKELQKDDVPLVQDEHPYDAPPARTIVKQRDVGSSSEQLSAADLRLRGQIQRVLAHYMNNPENTTRRGPWAIMHAALPFGVEGEIMAGNRRVNALGWMCYNGVCAKQRMFQPTKQGFRTNVGPGVQGHEGQFLAILAQSRVQPDYPILIGNRRYTIMDLAKYEMATCREKSELTFKLIGLAHYLEADQRWRDNQGRHWNLEKMVAEELAQPVIGAACGGTHRLMGLTFALVRRQQAGLPMTGHWHRAEVFINDFVNYAISLQNPDGSFSTNWFEGRGNEDDIERKLQTSGHIVEWLVFTLPDDQLRSPQIQRAVEFLASTLDANPKRDWAIGPRGHALRALALYHQRLYGGEPGQMREVLTAALKNSSTSR